MKSVLAEVRGIPFGGVLPFFQELKPAFHISHKQKSSLSQKQKNTRFVRRAAAVGRCQLTCESCSSSASRKVRARFPDTVSSVGKVGRIFLGTTLQDFFPRRLLQTFQCFFSAVLKDRFPCRGTFEADRQDNSLNQIVNSSEFKARHYLSFFLISLLSCTSILRPSLLELCPQSESVRSNCSSSSAASELCTKFSASGPLMQEAQRHTF